MTREERMLQRREMVRNLKFLANVMANDLQTTHTIGVMNPEIVAFEMREDMREWFRVSLQTISAGLTEIETETVDFASEARQGAAS